jgi:outer membrane protein assembly complex protein YaeT
MRAPRFALLCRLAVLALLLTVYAARAQGTADQRTELEDRPIAEIVIRGLDADVEQLVRNNIRAAAGDPFEWDTVAQDTRRIEALGRFRNVSAEVELAPDGSVRVIYSITPQAIIREVQTIGNRAVSDQDLRAKIRLSAGLVRDDYLIEKAKRDIKATYREKGYYLTSVSVDQAELEQRGILIFRIIEGPRVKILDIQYEGNDAFSDKQLSGQVRTKTHIPLLRPGVLDEDVIADDVAKLDRFYKDRGYIDVRVDRLIQLSPDNREAKLVFLVDEGRQYILGSIRVERAGAPGEPTRVFSPEQIAALVELQPGDVYSEDKIRDSRTAIQSAYGSLGYVRAGAAGVVGTAGPANIEINVREYSLRIGERPVVDVIFEIDEGEPAKVGVVDIADNFLTKDKIIRRLISLKPGRPLDTTELRESQRRIQNTRLFSDVRITVQRPDPIEPEYRDLLVEVKERNTGSVNFGVAIGSDAGLFGEISLNQQNFDIADFPQSFGELVTGRAFRGAGQSFNMTIRPGNEIFEYSVSLTEPHLLETNYALSVAGNFRQRDYSQYDEKRLTGWVSLGRELGDIWQLGLRTRAENVKLDDIEPDAPVDVFESAGPDTLTSLGITLTRTTVSTFTRPGRGSRLELALESTGVFGGDYSFFNAQTEYTVFFTIDEDFLGRRTTLKFNTRIGYIFGSDTPPVYERYYLGGRSFRGFEFRTVSPKGVRNDNGEIGDDPVGGEWLLFLGSQYEFPIYQEVVTGVLFVDSGTVTNNPGFDDYRVSVGGGLRLYIPQLGPVPIALDFGIPIVKEDRDEDQVFSFSAELPF